MSSHDPAEYGRHLDGRYDVLYPPDDLETAATVSTLARYVELSGVRRFVEFGIGTGRIGLPVQERQIEVAGVDGSDEMVAELRAKPGGDRVEVVIGDYRSARVRGEFGVVALVFNGILDDRGLATQLDIFANAARHLVPGGFFVVESWVMTESQRSGDWSVAPRYVSPSHVELQMSRYDLSTNSIDRTMVHIRPGATDFVTVKDGYASPGELDVMAHVAGFDRVARDASWSGEPFTHTSTRHVSVYRHVRNP